MTLVQQLRGQPTPLLLVDGGEAFFPAPSLKTPTPSQASRLFRKASTIVNAFNLLGYQVMAVGPSDLQLGIAKLKELEAMARFPFISANLVDAETGKTIFAPYQIVESAGVRVGLFSVLLSSVNPTYASRAFPSAKLLDPKPLIGDLVKELRAKSDVVILLSQLNSVTNREILEAHPGIDVLVDAQVRNGIKNVWISENEYFTSFSNRPVLKIDGQGSRVGMFEMTFSGAKKLAEYEGYDIALEPHFMNHPEMETLVRRGGKFPPEGAAYDPYALRLSDELLGQEGCASCHEEQFKFWKATPHANTFASLEKDGDQHRRECIGCHTVGYGVAFAKPDSVGDFKEAQCESCHGLRPGHAENPRLVRFGAVKEDTCWGCHNPQILEKPFDYKGVLKDASCPKIKR